MVTVRRFGVTLYRMTGDYVLAPDGTGVDIEIKERFGPVPGLLSGSKRVKAQIGAGGMNSTYQMPLLGSVWEGTYTVASDREQVVAVYESAWGWAREEIRRRRKHVPL